MLNSRKKYKLVFQVLLGKPYVLYLSWQELILDNCTNGFINIKLWDTMVLLINLKDDDPMIAK